jgi:adenosylcobinamide-phosphate synthase
MAGALGVRLGGLNYYFGQPSRRPTLGDAHVTLARAHLGEATRLMLFTGALAAVVFLGLRWLLMRMVGGDA